MTLDISAVLEDWPFRPEEITARVIEGDDGERRIQLRLDLGLLQMCVDGRPDGRRIHDTQSWLAYHQQRQVENDEANPDGAPYLLEPEDCAELLREGVQYYHRYLCFWHLEMYELCARDTKRNLQLFHFVREHARHDRDKLQFDQWRPYVTMMHARAVATPLVQLEQWDAAVNAVDAGIRGIERFLEEYDQLAKAPTVGELAFLRRWKKEIQAQFQPDAPESSGEGILDAEEANDDPLEQLKKQLESAISDENYEEAARLRDELRKLEDPPPPGF